MTVLEQMSAGEVIFLFSLIYLLVGLAVMFTAFVCRMAVDIWESKLF